MSRQFADFKEAQNEIARDLAELGIEVPPMYQSKDRVGAEYTTKELNNYTYTVLNTDISKLEGVHVAFVEQEIKDRVVGGLNPGKAWKTRREMWLNLMEFNDPVAEARQQGTFSYTYSDRMGGPKIDQIIDELSVHPFSRQLYLPVWNMIDGTRLGHRRVPCSLGYQFINRGGSLHVTYMMRSCDFKGHWPNDVALAVMLRDYICERAAMDPGTFTQFITSLHVFKKDVEGVF